MIKNYLQLETRVGCLVAGDVQTEKGAQNWAFPAAHTSTLGRVTGLLARALDLYVKSG